MIGAVMPLLLAGGLLCAIAWWWLVREHDVDVAAARGLADRAETVDVSSMSLEEALAVRYQVVAAAEQFVFPTTFEDRNRHSKLIALHVRLSEHIG